MILSSLFLFFMGWNVYASRRLDDIRKSYPMLSINQLVEVIIRKGDMHAIYAIQAKSPNLAIPALSGIVHNEKVKLSCQMKAATSLGQIEDPKAREALLSAQKHAKDPNLLMAIEQALQAKK